MIHSYEMCAFIGYLLCSSVTRFVTIHIYIAVVVLMFYMPKNHKIRDYYGSGWVGRTLNFFGTSSQNSSNPVLLFWSSIPLCILSVYIC